LNRQKTTSDCRKRPSKHIAFPRKMWRSGRQLVCPLLWMGRCVTWKSREWPGEWIH